MMFERVGLAKMVVFGKAVMLSTVKLSDDCFETIVIFEQDGEELELIRTHDIEKAKKAHNYLLNKYNDLIYENSIDKLIGADNYGQYVTAVVAC